jgi:hypothetical protein
MPDNFPDATGAGTELTQIETFLALKHPSQIEKGEFDG